MSGNPVLGFYVDDVYYPGFDINLQDVERVEVLRGPQGTLYGRNTEAGVINVVTQKPSDQWTAKAGLGAGNYGSYEGLAMFSGPLVEDTLKMRFSGRYTTTDGYFKNNYDGSDDVDGSDNFDGRLTLDWTPDEDWNFLWASDVQDYVGKYAEFAPLNGIKDNPHEVDVDWDGRADKDAYDTSLRAERALQGMKPVSITAARSEDTLTENDVDFTSSDLMRLHLKNDVQLFSEELRLASEDKRPFQWLTGLYVFHEDQMLQAQTEMRPGSFPFVGSLYQKGDTETLGTAMFGQGSYTFFDRLTFTAGLRYDREAKDYDYSWRGGAFIGVPDTSGSSSKTFQAWLPKFSLDYAFTEDLNGYAVVSRGFKSGGFNLKADPGTPFDAEYTWNYETGIKSEWLERRLQVNLTAFYIQWEDQQVEVPVYPDFTVINAATSTSKGLEAEVRAIPLDGLELLSNFGYTFSTFDEFEYGGADYSGKRNPNVPGYTFLFGGTYRFRNGLFLNADYNRVGEHYLDLENTRTQGDYQTVDAKVGYAKDDYEVYLWGKNLTNTAYVTRAFYMSGAGQWYGRAGDPFTFGVNANITF